MDKKRLFYVIVPCVMFVVALIVLTVSLLPSVKYANEKNSFVYEKVDGGYAITGYNGNQKNISIPSSCKGEKVVEIADFAFANVDKFEGVETLVMPSSIVRIGRNAFCWV